MFQISFSIPPNDTLIIIKWVRCTLSQILYFLNWSFYYSIHFADNYFVYWLTLIDAYNIDLTLCCRAGVVLLVRGVAQQGAADLAVRGNRGLHGGRKHLLQHHQQNGGGDHRTAA